MDESIETTVKTVQYVSPCVTYQIRHHHPWVFPSAPWTRIHIDYLGPVNGNMYFVIVDAYSKFPEVVK